jgi:hypothetical protein
VTTEHKPQREPDVLPAFAVTLEFTVIVEDHAAAMKWATGWLDEVSGDDVVLSGGSAHVPSEPVEFFDE